MPSPPSPRERGLESSGLNGFMSGDYGDDVEANGNARSWGRFRWYGKGNGAYLNTFSLVEVRDPGDCDSDCVQGLAPVGKAGRKCGGSLLSIFLNPIRPHRLAGFVVTDVLL